MPEPGIQLRLLIFGTDVASVLVNKSDGKLPVATIPPVHKWQRESGIIADAVRDAYGLEVYCLRCLEMGDHSATIALELYPGEQTIPDTMQWVNRDAPVAQNLVRDFLSATARNSHPWQRTGFFGSVHTEWGFDGLTGRIEQVRNHGYTSCVLRSQTTDGMVYVKFCPPMYSYEGPLTAEIYRHYPHIVPQVLAHHNRGMDAYFVTRAYQGKHLNSLEDRSRYLNIWKTILTDFATMQRDYAQRPQDLLQTGCAVWSLQRLELYASGLHALVRQFADGASVSYDQLSTLQQRLVDACQQLADYRLPLTLHHGDFHSVNILSDGSSYRVVDWAFQAGLSHPFFFMTVVFEEHRDPATRNHLRDHYLQHWADYGTLDSLRAAFALSEGPALFHALLGHLTQFRNALDTWEIEIERATLEWLLKELLAWGERHD